MRSILKLSLSQNNRDTDKEENKNKIYCLIHNFLLASLKLFPIRINVLDIKNILKEYPSHAVLVGVTALIKLVLNGLSTCGRVLRVRVNSSAVSRQYGRLHLGHCIDGYHTGEQQGHEMR